MKIEDLKQLLKQRIAHLEQQYALAQQRGDIEAVLRFEADLDETRATLRQLGD